MSGARNIFVLLHYLLVLALPAVAHAAKPCSISTSRQFLVFGADTPGRGLVCDLSERIKSNFLRLLAEQDHWKTPLLINLDSPQANFPDTRKTNLEVSQLGFGLKLQLNFVVSRELQKHEVEREILRAILVERIYRERGDIAAGRPYVAPPDWLLDGLLALAAGNELRDNARLLENVVDGNKIAPLEEVVNQPRSQLNAASRRLFDAYSQALVELLLDTPGGPQKLVQFLVDLPTAPNDAVADLRVHFPETLGRAPQKWWCLSVARLSATNRHEILSAAETGQLLDRLLHFSIPGLDGKRRQYSLGDFAKFGQLPGSASVLEERSRQLLLLSVRVHPSYRAIVEEEYELTRLLARGQSKGVRERLDEVESYRAIAQRRANAIDDYLNWYEATQMKTISGAFTQVMKDAQTSKETRPHRRDPISVYLDSVEMEMQ